MPSSGSALRIGSVLARRYRMIGELGSGPSAVVWAAHDETLRRSVAVKILRLNDMGSAESEVVRRRFLADAKAAAVLRHPNIIDVLELGTEGDLAYTVLDLRRGGSLRDLLARGQVLTHAHLATMGAEAASGLDYMHRGGVVHGNLKAENILFDDESRAVLADPAPRSSVGATTSADVQALAVILTEAAESNVGQLEGGDGVGRSWAGDRGTPHAWDLGPLGPIIERAGSADPDKRPTAGEMAAELDLVGDDLPYPLPLPLAGRAQAPAAAAGTDDAPAPGAAGSTDHDPAPGAAGSTDHDPAPRAAGSTDDAPAPGLDEPQSAPWSTYDEEVENYSLADEGYAGDAQPPELDEGIGTGSAADPVYLGHGGEKPGFRRPVGQSGPGGSVRRSRSLVAVACLLALGLVVALVLGLRGSPTYRVPALGGDTVAAASGRLAHAHLKLSVHSQRYDSNAQAGTVIYQKPAKGRMAAGGVVRVNVSLGPRPVKVPKLVGLSLSDAMRVLSKAHLSLSRGTVKRVASITAPAGTVISAKPDSGTLLPGDSVRVVASSGKPRVKVPALSGPAVVSFTAAKAALAKYHLGAAATYLYSSSVPAGNVIYTRPAPGATVLYGATVTLEMSRGPRPVRVPQVSGRTVSQAIQILGAYGLRVSGIQGKKSQKVKSTSPGAGTLVAVGTSLVLRTG